MVADGLAPEEAAMLVTLFAEIFDGHNAAVADGVEHALGRPARDFTEFVRRAANAGCWAQAA